MKYDEFFGMRKNTFNKSFELIKPKILSERKYTIVELGTSRSFVTGGERGCMNSDPKYWQPNNPKIWDWGAGIFTKVFLDNLDGENIIMYTIDPSDSAISIVNTMCGGNKNLNIVKDYSSNFLNNYNGKIDFLYMDHMESSEEACRQHLEDIKIVIEHDLMSADGIILVDDVGDNITHTKGKYSIPYLIENGYEKLIHEYQVLLRRRIV
jgi:hypothetical protein